MDENEKIKGAEIAAQILKRLEPEHRERLVEAIENKAPEIATELVYAMAEAGQKPNLINKTPRLRDQIEIQRGTDLSELIQKQEDEISITNGSYEDEKHIRSELKGQKRRIA